MQLVVRPLELKDLPAANALIDEIHALHCAAHPQFFRSVQGALRSPEYWQGLLNDPNVGLFLALVDGEAAGFLHLVLRETNLAMMTPCRFVVVDTVVVAQAQRRRGIGRALMRRAESWAAEKCAERMELNVFDFNRPAIALYEELGFNVLSRRMVKEFERGEAAPKFPS